VNKSKKYVVAMIISILLMFLWILLTVHLTDGRDIAEFTDADRQIFTGFCIVEAITVILMLLFAKKVVKIRRENGELPTPVAPTRLEKILRRRGVLLLSAAIVLGFATSILGLACGYLLPFKSYRAVFWICAPIPVALGAASVLLRYLYFNQLEKKSVAETQTFLLSHREQAVATAAEKLRLLANLRKLTHGYAFLIALLAFVSGVCGGAMTIGNTSVQTLIMWWSAFLYLCALTRLQLPTPAALLEDDPGIAREEEYPQLYAIAKASAQSQGWDGKILIRLQDDCNAGVRKFGDSCCIYMGVILLNILTKEEMQAVFCHEFSHIMREQVTDSKEVRHYNWLGQGGNQHFLSVLTSFLYEFPDALYLLQFELYRYADTIAAESAADQAMCALSGAADAASALVKLRYHDLFEWEFGTYDVPCLYASEQPDEMHLFHRLEAIKSRTQQNCKRWNDLISVEIQSRGATHPITKERLAGLGVTRIPVIRFPQKDAYLAECEKALEFVAKEICRQLKESYANDRETYYLTPKKQVEEWEASGKPIIAESYAVVDQALRQLGRNLEAELLCQRASEELSPAAACYADFMHGCFLLRTYDDSGIDYVYRAIDANHNYIEPGLDVLGEYCCITGNQDALDDYRNRSVNLMQQTKDVYSEMGTLRKGDRLQPESLPEELYKGLLAFIGSLDDRAIDRVYLVRKIITDTDFASAVVVKFRTEAEEETKAELLDKFFYHLDTCSDWQFALFDYDQVSKVKVETIENSCIYIQSDYVP